MQKFITIKTKKNIHWKLNIAWNPIGRLRYFHNACSFHQHPLFLFSFFSCLLVIPLQAPHLCVSYYVLKYKWTLSFPFLVGGLHRKFKTETMEGEGGETFDDFPLPLKLTRIPDSPRKPGQICSPSSPRVC